jgi:hypothetical protein
VPYQTALSSSLAPDLVAMFTGLQPHPDVAAAEPLATVAGLAAAARMAAAILGEPVSLSSADGRVAVAGAPDLAPGQVRLVASDPRRRVGHH